MENRMYTYMSGLSTPTEKEKKNYKTISGIDNLDK